MIFVANSSFENDPDLPFPEIAFFALQESGRFMFSRANQGF